MRLRILSVFLTPLIIYLSPFATLAAEISGPITGGARGAPYSAGTPAPGYVYEEYFLSGEAKAYQLVDGATLSKDGMWQTTARAASAPFKSRFLVVRPESDEAFNGTVVVFWQNVTAGRELGSADGEHLRGYAWVGVSAQKVGIDGFPDREPSGLKAWDSARYGSLQHPGDGYSYDIFTQAARAVAPDRPRDGQDPMGGLTVKRMIAAGASQSASRLRTYINGVHQHEKIFDGYLPYIDFSSVVPFEADFGERRRQGWRGFRIRSDLDVPVMVVNSETETLAYFPARQPDSDRFRFWEVAGTSHVTRPRSPTPTSGGANWLSFLPVYAASIRHLHHWVKDGTQPPRMPLIDVALEDSAPRIARDAHGNATGGIRLPDIEVPSASHSGMGQRGGGERLAWLFGLSSDFPEKQLAKLYPGSKAYLDAYDAALAANVAAGTVLAEDAPGLRAGAAEWAKRLDRSGGKTE